MQFYLRRFYFSDFTGWNHGTDLNQELKQEQESQITNLIRLCQLSWPNSPLCQVMILMQQVTSVSLSDLVHMRMGIFKNTFYSACGSKIACTHRWYCKIILSTSNHIRCQAMSSGDHNKRWKVDTVHYSTTTTTVVQLGRRGDMRTENEADSFLNIKLEFKVFLFCFFF